MLLWPPIQAFAGGAALLLLAAASLFTAGCNGASGGGIPVGPTRAELSGVVTASTDPNQTVPGATVTLTAADSTVFTTTTGSSGTYDFPSVPVGHGKLKVSPPPGQDLKEQDLDVDVSADSADSVVASLPPQVSNIAVTGIEILPSSIPSIQHGQKATITVTITGQNIPAGAQPSLVVTGGIGQILPHGEFHAVHPGTGTITATFEGVSASIPVTVV